MHVVDISVREHKKLDKARNIARSLWFKACVWDQVPPNSVFVVFSPENPYAHGAGRAALLLNRLVDKADKGRSHAG